MADRRTDPGSLTPTEYLVGELVAARYRLGEPEWTLRNDTQRAALRLEQRGLLTVRSGIVENTYRAALTPAGHALFLSPTYRPPHLNEAGAVLLVGNLSEGFEVVGPYVDVGAALDSAALDAAGGDYWAMTVTPPPRRRAF